MLRRAALFKPVINSRSRIESSQEVDQIRLCDEAEVYWADRAFGRQGTGELFRVGGKADYPV